MEQILFQKCVHIHVHTHEHEYRLTEQVNMIISEDKQQKKATYLTRNYSFLGACIERWQIVN